MKNLNLNLRRYLVVILSTGMLCSAARQPPSCALSCTSSAASQIGCNIYKLPCFCSSPQFLSAARSCIQETCAAPDIQDATDFINDLCSISSEAVSTASSSDRPSATSGASQNAAAASLKLDMSLMGGALGILQVVAAMT
ncbi:hypothetical protein BJY52DRAFT_964053 [Lactarius psammicola]|nr:hypothetical protein BJY52DRAFT_964053 [Lactarius psammicola]